MKVDIFEENKRLRVELEQEKRLHSEWQNKYYELKKRLDILEAQLNQILNSNTPSSRLPFTVKNNHFSLKDDEILDVFQKELLQMEQVAKYHVPADILAKKFMF